MKDFKLYNKQDLLVLTRLRRYESKLGELLLTGQPGDSIEQVLERHPARFVLLGIPEDIGVKANLGTPGTSTLWWSFLKAFFNIQSTDRFSGRELIALGHFDFQSVDQLVEEHARNSEEKWDAYRHTVANVIDPQVEEVVLKIVKAGKVPIVIGGGHNNAYPVIKATAKGLQKRGDISKSAMNTVNLDAHADYRLMEGRHSGNAFRYALEEGYLHRYSVIGLHENYNAQSMLDDIYSQPDIQVSFYEDIFIREQLNFRQAVAQAFHFTEGLPTGVELDLDCIENTLSSAVTPTGISSTLARQYLEYAARFSRPAYLHICEGASHLANGQEQPMIGKLVAFLVSDFIRASSY